MEEKIPYSGKTEESSYLAFNNAVMIFLVNAYRTAQPE